MSVTRREAREALWRRGNLSYKLRPYQREMRDRFRGSKRKVSVNCCGRRLGKTYTACVIAIEACLSKPKARTMYSFPSQKQARKVVVPTMAKVLEDCPADLRPSFNKVDLTWTWPNGAVIHLAGCDDENAADNLRGDEMDLGIVDEGGFIGILRYVMDSVLMPQTLTTGGRILVISSPPKSGQEHFFYKLYEECDRAGDACCYPTSIAEPWLAPGELDALIAEAGGPTSVAARREYGAEFIVDLDAAVVPEFTTNREHLIGIVPRPTYFCPIVSADLGFRDMSVALFGYSHFELGKVVIEDEVVCVRESAIAFGRKIAAKEYDIAWRDRRAMSGDGEPMRVADAPLQLLADIVEATGVAFGPAKKDDAEAALNYLRRYCLEKRLVIHPRCKTLLAHLSGAVWNKGRTSYERTEADGHFDGVDALKYLLRHVDQHTNPSPGLPDGVTHGTHWIPPQAQREREHHLASAFRWK